MLATVLAYLMWGFFPAYFPLLTPASPVEILAHRVLWSAVLMTIVLTLTGGWTELTRADRGTWLRLVAAGYLITANWGIYVVAVNSAHVAEAALGYFINPLLSVALALLFLGERLRRGQLATVAIATIGVAWLTFLTGQPPFLSLGLAVTFGVYGLIKKQVRISPIASLAAETLVVAPVAIAYLAWLELNGTGTFFNNGPSHAGLLIASGIITALPLYFYGLGTTQIPLATIGILQYITPTMQMLWALFVTHEYLSTSRWAGFIIIWVAVAWYLGDLASRRRRPT